MALDIEKVRVAITGGVRVAPVGTAAPASTETAYAAAWRELGYLSEDGITEGNSTDSTEIKAWQNGQVVRRVLSSAETTFQFTAIETKPEVWALYYPGSDLAVEGGQATLTVTVPQEDPRAFAFDVIDGGSHVRILVGRGEIGERGDIVYKGDEPIGYEFTMTCYPVNDVVMVKITNDEAFAEAA